MIQTLKNQNICFIGAGSMAEAMIRGLLERKKTRATKISIVNRHNQNRLESLHKKYGIQVKAPSKDKNDFIKEAEIVVLAMKPKDVGDALTQIRPFLHEKQLLISVIAGLSIDKIKDHLEMNIPTIRTMPNTSSAIGLGATGMSFSSNVQVEHKEVALEIFQSIGIVSIVEEQQLNMVTGLSGSGPAYIYYMIEAMIQAGIEGGLSNEQSTELTIQTVLGSAQMVKITNEAPSILRQKVTSPGGTTQAAIEVLHSHHFPEIIKKAIFRSSERASEIGNHIITKKSE